MRIDKRREHESMPIRPVLLAAAIALGSLLASFAGHAQYPSRPVKLIVSSAAGSGPDVIARSVAERLSPLLGQPIVIESHAGANGNIAVDLVAKSPPDGYTLMLCPDSTIVINPHMYTKLAVDPLKVLAPVASVAITPSFFLAVHPSVPAKNFQEFIEYAKKAKPPLSYASAGNGSQHQMAMEMLKLRAGIDLLHVPYKGGAPAATATIAGEVAAMFSGASTGPQIHAGRLRGLATTGRIRSPQFPKLPTIGEFYPGYELSVWLGIFAPAGVPEAVLTRLRTEINRALATREVRERLDAAGGNEPYATTPQEFADRINADYEKYGNLVKRIGVKID